MKKLFKGLAFLFISLLLALFFLEFTARFIVKQPYYAFPDGYFVPNEFYGYALAKDFKGRYAQPEFNISIDTNSDGLRDIEHDSIVRAFKILALGDSFSFGVGVELESTYLSRLEQALNQDCGQEKFSVIKAGVVGYSTFNEKIYLIKKGLSYQPDLVLIQFWWDDLGVDRITYLSHMGFLTQGPIKNPQDFRLFLNRHVRSYALLRRVFSAISEKSLFPLRLANDDEDRLVLEAKAAVTLKEFKEIEALCALNHAKCLFVLIPPKEFVFKKNSSWDYFCTVLSNNKVPYVDLLPVLKNAQATERPVFFNIDLHLNQNGHKVVAQELSRFLCGAHFLKK
jgi:hypothetical protein